MKTFFRLNIFFIFFLVNVHLIAQDYLDIAPTTNTSPSLSTVILGDTTATGEPVSENRVYRLERGGLYLMDRTIQFDHSLHIISDGDKNKRPAMIIRGRNAEAENIKSFFIIAGDNTNNIFKDIFFNAIDLDKKNTDWTQAVIVTADQVATHFEGCIFNAYTGGAISFRGSNAKIYVNDCIWRNGVSATHMFIGQQLTMPKLPVDTLIVVNNTYFNNNSFWLFQEDALIGYQVIEHNTIFTSLIDCVRLRYSSNASIRSNIFYGTHAYGDSEEFRALNVYEIDGSKYSIISINEVPSNLLDAAGISEQDRKIILSNNAYFTPTVIKNYWTTNNEVDDQLEWMNTRTKNLFNSHFGFINQKNINEDPSFSDTDMDTWVTKAVADFCTTYRATLTPGEPLSGDAGTVRNYDEHVGDDILTGISWPLPENLAYTNDALLTGGHDGYPIGDLNWFPELKTQWVSTKSIQKQTKIFISPNPAKNIISFSTNQNITKIEIYDVFGNLIQKYMNLKNESKSIHIGDWPNGIYFSKISTKYGFVSKSFVKI